MKIQKNIRVSQEVAEWMDRHPLSNNALVTYALHLLMQMEVNAVKPPQIYYTSFVPKKAQADTELPNFCL